MRIPVARRPAPAGGRASPVGRGGRARPAPSLLALGDLMLDVVVAPDRAPERGTDVPGVIGFRQGGSAANTARTFASLGGRASLVAGVGDDAWARWLAASLRAEGVRTYLARAAGPTGRVAALVDPDGERSFVTQRGGADALRPSHLEERWFLGLGVLHVTAYSLVTEPVSRAALKAARMARQQGAMVSVDLSSRGPLLAFGVERVSERLAELAADIMFADRGEAAALLGSTAPRALPDLLGVAPLAVVKSGPQGCRVLWRDGAGPDVLAIDVAAARVSAAETTGAGDAFAAGFLHALLSSTPEPSPGQAPASPERVLASPERALASPGAHPAWSALQLRRAALAGHRAAASLLRGRRPPLAIR